MKVLLFSMNYPPEVTGMGKYSAGLAEWLADHGHEVRVTATPPYYPHWVVSSGYRASRYTTEVRKGVRGTRRQTARSTRMGHHDARYCRWHRGSGMDRRVR